MEQFCWTQQCRTQKMPRKVFNVRVEMNIQAVTCPGVWLCPTGRVSLLIYMLGSTIQTRCADPVFPITLNEKLVFSRLYVDANKLSALQKKLYKDHLYMELIQWSSREKGNVLATFETRLADLLYPESRKNGIGSAEVDLLMDPMENFPGILAPKIVVRTKTTIEDKVYDGQEDVRKTTDAKRVSSSCYCTEKKAKHALRQKPVCHVKRGSQGRKCELEPSPSVMLRKVTEAPLYCPCSDCNQMKPEIRQSEESQETRCSTPTSSESIVLSVKPSPIIVEAKSCQCFNDEHSDNCHVCAKYKHYFERQAKREVDAEGGNDCECSDDDVSKVICNYPKRNNLSVAQQIHSRLGNTLNRRAKCSERTWGEFYHNLYNK